MKFLCQIHCVSERIYCINIKTSIHDWNHSFCVLLLKVELVLYTTKTSHKFAVSVSVLITRHVAIMPA